MTQPTCKDLWKENKDSRIDDLRQLLDADPEKGVDGLGTLDEYGLCFDYVAPDTFRDQKEGFWRYQISTGGPGDELRFYSSHWKTDPYRIAYTYLDWFDGHEESLSGDDLKVALRLWRDFVETESTRYQYEESMKDWEPQVSDDEE